MSERRPPPDPGDDEFDEPSDELPPMTDDELGEDDTPLDSFLEEQRDDGMSWLDDEVGIDDYDAATIADEIGAESGEEQTWLDGSEGDETLEGTETDFGDDQEYGWTADNDEPDAGTFYDDLDFGEEQAGSILDDTGEEGLDDDDMAIDTSSWAELDDEEGEGPRDLEEIELGLDDLTYEQEMRMSGALLPEPLDESILKAAWLGPPGAPATTVGFGAGTLFAAGAGLYTLEEGRLVPTRGSNVVEDVVGTSVAAAPEASGPVFVGTMLGGLLRSDDMGKTFEKSDAWVSLLVAAGVRAAPSQPVTVAASPGKGHQVLWLLVGGGHLLRSDDAGRSWTATVADRRVAALACDPSSDAVAFLAEREGALEVLHARGGATFRPRQVPTEIATRLLAGSEPSLAVKDDLVLLGAEELTDGLLLSDSPSSPFEVIADCPRCTAMAVGDGPTPYILAALFFPGRDLGTILRSTDGGRSWSRLCDVSRLCQLFDVDVVGQDDVSSRVHQLAVTPSAEAQIAMATGMGVFVVEMKDL